MGGVTLMNARNQRNKAKQNKIDHAMYDDMDIDSNQQGNKSQNKTSFDDKMKAYLLKRNKLISDAKKQKENFMEQLKLGNVDSLIHEMEAMQNKNHLEMRRKPIFSNKKKKETKPQSSVHQNMIKEIKNKKRKLDNRKSAENGNNDDQEPLVKK